MLLPILDLIMPTQFFVVHLTLSCLKSRDHGTPLLVLSFNPMPPLQLNHCLNNCSGIESQSTAESTPSWLQLLGSLLLNQPTSLFQSYQPGHSGLCSADDWLLHEPSTNTNFGARAFQCAALAIWNSIPLSVRSSP